MPKLHICGRYWNIASDDLVWPFLLATLSRLPWFITIIVVFERHDLTVECNDGHLAKVYYHGMLTVLCLQICCSFVIIFVSMRGTILNAAPRRYINILLYIQGAIYLPEMGFLTLGLYWSLNDTSNCKNEVIRAVLATAILGWALVLVLLMCVAIHFDCIGALSEGGNPSKVTSRESRRSKVLSTVSLGRFSDQNWQKCLKFVCCCLKADEGSGQSLASVAGVFGRVFSVDFLTTSDVAAGLFLLDSLEKQAKSNPELEPVTQSPEAHDVPVLDHYPCPEPWMTVDQAKYFFKYAWGSYGWKYYVLFKDFWCGPCRMCIKCHCWNCCCRREPHVFRDNCCQSNTTAFKQLSGIDDEDLFYSSFISKISYKPFVICYDRTYHVLVLAIRGTLSAEDAVTDANAEPTQIDLNGKRCYVHRGFYEAVQGMISPRYHYPKACCACSSDTEDEDEENRGVFVDNGADCLKSVEKLLQEAYNKFNVDSRPLEVVVTGHSLGAGMAAIMATILQGQGFWTDKKIRCFAYSPPGWTASGDFAMACSQTVMSVVCGNDMVGRAGLYSMEVLKHDMLMAITVADRPKYQIMTSQCGPGCLASEVNQESVHLFSSESSTNNPRQVTDLLELTPKSMKPKYLVKLFEHIECARKEMKRYDEHNVRTAASVLRESVKYKKLYIPGQILYLQLVKEAKGCLDDPVFKAVWARPSHFQRITVSISTMVRHHCPDMMEIALDQAINPQQRLKVTGDGQVTVDIETDVQLTAL